MWNASILSASMIPGRHNTPRISDDTVCWRINMVLIMGALVSLGVCAHALWLARIMEKLKGHCTQSQQSGDACTRLYFIWHAVALSMRYVIELVCFHTMRNKRLTFWGNYHFPIFFRTVRTACPMN